MTVIEEIAAERKRQIEVEGYTPEKDKALPPHALLTGALSYTSLACTVLNMIHETQSPLDMIHHFERDGVYAEAPRPEPWELNPEMWKPKSVRKDLIRAAALIIATIEMVDEQVGTKTARLYPVKFTQFLLPVGRPHEIEFLTTIEVSDKAKLIVDAGFKFECEVLRTHHVSLTIGDSAIEQDVAISVVANDRAALDKAIDKLILEFNIEEHVAERTKLLAEGAVDVNASED